MRKSEHIIGRYGISDYGTEEKEKIDMDALFSKKYLRWFLTIFSLSIGLILTFILALAVGPVDIPKLTVFKILFHFPQSWPDTYEIIVLEVRLPRVILAGLVGAGLAVAGCAMQGLLRNPIASPYVLGLSSGAAFGAAVAIVLGFSFVKGSLAIPFMAFIFALIAIFLVYNIARIEGLVPTETLLLAGIAVGLFFSAMVAFLQYIAGENLHSLIIWLLGGFWASSWNKVYIALPLILLGIVGTLYYSRELNLMLLGEEHALNLGVNVESVKKSVLVFSTLTTAAAVSVSGIIGFVGIIVPHIMRIFVGPDHRILLPSSGLVGAIFLIWMDTLARTIIQPTELPVGVITALLGAPFFLYLLRSRKRLMGW